MPVNQTRDMGLYRRAFQPLNKPRHIALGLVLGAVVGVIPKFSVIPWALGVCGLLLPVNLLSFVGVAVLGSLVGHVFDPWFHEVGHRALVDPVLQDFWQWIVTTDFFVWSKLNNTVVAGSSALGAALVLPSYFVLRSLIIAMFPLFNRSDVQRALVHES